MLWEKPCSKTMKDFNLKSILCKFNNDNYRKHYLRKVNSYLYDSTSSIPFRPWALFQRSLTLSTASLTTDFFPLSHSSISSNWPSFLLVGFSSYLSPTEENQNFSMKPKYYIYHVSWNVKEETRRSQAEWKKDWPKLLLTPTETSWKSLTYSHKQSRSFLTVPLKLVWYCLCNTLLFRGAEYVWNSHSLAVHVVSPRVSFYVSDFPSSQLWKIILPDLVTRSTFLSSWLMHLSCTRIF